MKVKSVCIYCGSSNQARDVFQQTAAEIGQKLAENDFRLVYGGGRLGLMGIVANSCVKAGGYVIGYIPHHLDEFEGANTEIQELHLVDSMHTRKFRMAENSDAFVILPGGFGTLDELFEIITWRQLNLHEKPIILLNIEGYWNPLIALIHQIIDESFAKPEHRDFIKIANSVDDVLKVLQVIELDDPSFNTKLA